MFRLVRGLKTDSKEVEGGRCIRGSDGKLCFNVKESDKFWKDYIERVMNKENDWDHSVEGDAVEGPVVCVSREEVLQALNEMKTGKSPGPSEVSLGLITASYGVGIQVMAEICQRVLDGFGMQFEWALSMVVPIFSHLLPSAWKIHSTQKLYFAHNILSVYFLLLHNFMMVLSPHPIKTYQYYLCEIIHSFIMNIFLLIIKIFGNVYNFYGNTKVNLLYASNTQ